MATRRRPAKKKSPRTLSAANLALLDAEWALLPAQAGDRLSKSVRLLTLSDAPRAGLWRAVRSGVC